MYWYRFELTGDQIGEGGLGRMERQFEEHVVRRRAWKSVCLLRQWQPYEAGAVFYLCAATPVNDEALSRLFSARQCDPPSVTSIRFWSGDVDLNESLSKAASS
jgi:hypothetical protein